MTVHTEGSSSTTRMECVPDTGACCSLGGSTGACRSVLASWRGEASKKYREKVVPTPGALRTVIRPPFCAMIPATAAKPSPVPLPIGFVVKNGSKIRALVAASMPLPVSRMSSVP